MSIHLQVPMLALKFTMTQHTSMLNTCMAMLIAQINCLYLQQYPLAMNVIYIRANSQVSLTRPQSHHQTPKPA